MMWFSFCEFVKKTVQIKKRVSQQNFENLLKVKQNAIGQPDLQFFRIRLHFIFSIVQHLWNDFQFKITRNWELPSLFNVFTVRSASNDLFTDSILQSVRQLWPIITLKVVTGAMAENVAMVGKGSITFFFGFEKIKC